MAAALQVRLLLWKDYLIRKRKPITLSGVAWATLVMLCLYAVRINVDNTDYPTCQFAARALPSAGVLNFLQSFICNVNNECSELDKFEEIPAYEKSSFSKLKNELSPLLDDADSPVATGAVLHAARLLSTLANVADNPVLLDLTRHGLHVSDLFKDPKRAKRYLSKQLDISDDVSNSVIIAEVGLNGIFQGDIDRCKIDSVSKIIKINNSEHLKIFVEKLCALSKKEVENLVVDLILKVDLGKYVKMLGEMYSKLSGDTSFVKLGDMVSAVLRMMAPGSFLPQELSSEEEFSYINITMLSKVIDLFEPTFGETESFKSIKEVVDTAVLGSQYLHKFLVSDDSLESTDTAVSSISNMMGVDKVKRIYRKIVDALSETSSNDVSDNFLNILSRIINFVFKWLPDNQKHEILFYSTLLSKVIEGSQKVIIINADIESVAYNVSLRNPQGVKLLLSLPPNIVGNGLEALADAERTQILTSKLNDPGQIFCDVNGIKNIFLVSNDEAGKLKSKLCNDVWKSYINDLVSSFGIYVVKENINSMASLFILEAIGKDISDQLYSIDKDINILKNFVNTVKKMDDREIVYVDWATVFNISDNSELLKVFQSKARLGKHMLITVHGALAKEVVRQNPLLEYKISPFLKNMAIMVDGMNRQLDVAPRDLQALAKKLYPNLVQTLLATAVDEDKTYKILSTPCADVFCNGPDYAGIYLNFPININREELVPVLCNITLAIEEGLTKESIIGKVINKIKTTKHSVLDELNWTQLITDLNKLYAKLNDDYTYLFDKTFGMDEALKKNLTKEIEEIKDFWFNFRNLNRAMHLSIKLGFRLLDILDYGSFDLSHPMWREIKVRLNSAIGPLTIVDDVLKVIGGTSRNDSRSIPGADAISALVIGFPRLITDAVDLIIRDDTDVQEIISLLNAAIPWPCVSITTALDLSPSSVQTVQAIEKLMCLELDLQEKWRTYLEEKMVYPENWNTTVLPKNIFLKFSAAFDLLIKDLDIINENFKLAFEESEDGSITFASAIQYSIDAFNNTNKNEILIKFLSKVDTVLNSINTSSIQDTVSLNILWREYLNCSQAYRGQVINDHCKTLGRATWKNTFKFISVALENITEDLSTYLEESREQNATILQKLGFTKNTGLYMLYDKLPDFLAVLLNSYFDYGFMSKVLRASETQFWDCEELVGALAPAAPDAPALTAPARALLCPSLLYWVSMPRGVNTLIDLFTKPQYLFFSLEVSNLTSEYEKSYTNFNELTTKLNNISHSDTTLTEDIKISKLKENLVHAVDTVLSYRMKATEPRYRNFSENSKKQYTAMVYLTRVVTMINKLTTALNTVNVSDVDSKTLETELPSIQKMFKRRPSEVMAFHFDLITDVLWTNDTKYKMVEALTSACDRLKNKDTSKDILVELDRVKAQICAKQYTSLYGALQNVIDEDYDAARNSLMNVVDAMDDGAVADLSVFFNESKALVNSLKTSIKYAYDLGTSIYLKYLLNNLKHYDLIISFLSGENWWGELRKLYNGPQASDFFDTVEQVLGISEDILTHLDKIHLVKLFRDVNVNSTDSLCHMTLSEYAPDGSGALSSLLTRACFGNRTLLLRELPPLMFASQGLDDDLKISDEIDYDTLYLDMSNTESNIEKIRDGPKSPSRPPWITEESLSRFRTVATNLLSTESLIDISFGILANGVDAGTLFLNNSQCTLCSSLTSWLKQLNLQLYKRQEYDSLLCALDAMKLDEIHASLRNNFHWDMAITEIISTRNYTKYELNKSMNELLEQVKLHLMEDVSTNGTKLFQCLAKNVTRNMFGNAALFAKVVSRTAKLIRAMLPHLQEIPGITELSYFKELYKHVAHKLHVNDTLIKYLNEKTFSSKMMEVVKNKKLVQEIESAEADLFVIKDGKPSKDSVFIKNISWDEICSKYNCDKIMATINTLINRTLVEENLLNKQKSEFWKFTFISTTVQHIEDLVEHLAGIVGGVSDIDVAGVSERRMVPVLDAVLTIVRDDFMDPLELSVLGVVKQLEPLIHGTALELDITAVIDGLKILRQFKTSLVKQGYKIRVSTLFPDSYTIESSLNALGINTTNFWSVAAPRIRGGEIEIKSVLAHKGSIRDFVCDIDTMSLALSPGDLEPVSRDDVLAAVVEQFCDVGDDLARDILLVLIDNVDYPGILNIIKTELLSQLFKASNLTESEGHNVLSKLSEIGSQLPEMRERFEKIGTTMANEPLIARLKNGSVGEVLASSDFFSEAGNMMCGSPLQTQIGRLYRSVARAPDQKAEPDQKQLDALPTEYCRSLYKDIVNMEGGKILWSFVKPLVMGKILYTPPSPTVTRIIEKANATFSPMMRLMNMVHEFSSSFPHIRNLTTHRDGLKALQNLVTMPRFRELRESLIGNVSAPDVDVDQIFDQLGDVESLGSLMSRASSLLRCVSTQRFFPATSEHDLALEAARLTTINEFSAGLVFMDVRESNHFPSNISYKIRMDIENSPTTKRIKNYFWTPGPEGSFLENMRYFRGFIQIQDIIDKAIIELSLENARNIQKREIKEKSDWAIYTQQLPYPCYRKDFFQTSLYESQSLIVAFFFSLLFSVCSAVRFIVRDKETGNTMLMSVMGVDLRCHTLSWFVSSFLELVLTMCCVCIVLCGGRVLPRSEPSLVLTLLLIYGFSVLSFCYMMSKMFSGAGAAAVVSGLAYLLSFMPFVLILSLEAVMTSSLKIFVSLSMSSSVCYSFLFITRLEAMGLGAGWSQLWETPEGSTDMSIGIAGLMVFADGILYLIVGLVLDRYFGIKTSSNITTLQASDEKAGVSIVNVSKEYKAGVRALDGVSMELHRGQITTLLGHNGAGKTTLIKILTGMLKPTNGHVIVRTEGAAGGARLGVCPQHDVLFEQLSAREHVQLYAQLKSNRALIHLQDEVDSMLSVLSLGAVCDRPVSQLSGGTRRRLCVGLAFVGQPALVSLDEPTAGVDPAARRDIWSMIMKLRENRTILMTTHHLDEAELLSDQIIIMHKGQIHTTGSPIEIKRTLGTGYKLTVTYPETGLPEDETEDVGIEEKTKDLLAVVRNVIKNANLVDVNGSEVEINLPFYDANGVNNDLQGACEALESAPGAGRRQVALDCSSLEQVFHDLCRRADAEPQTIDCDVLSLPESSTSVSGSSKEDLTPLVELEGPLKGTLSQQFCALMYARYLHYIRNKWLLLILVVLPSLFLAAAMAFSSIRPPADIEVSLALEPQLYEPSTRFMIKQPSIYSKNIDPSFSRSVLDTLQFGRRNRNWTNEDSPSCKCVDAHQHCNVQTDRQWDLPEMMLLPDVTTLNNWLVDSQQVYIEKRYGGFSATIRNNLTHLVAWYNNKGHHAMPVYVNALNSAILKSVTGDPTAAITVYTHPLKISTEQLNKDNVYQHIADAGISAMLLIAYSLAGAGGAALAVSARVGRQKQLQLLCGTPPALLVALQLLWDMAVIGVNMLITAIILEIFHFPVFVAKNNLPAICILILLYGYACSGLVSVFEKLFRDPSLATMLLFCGNAFAGLVGIALLIILDVISNSDATDHARYILHKILLLSPQFAFGDGLLEIAKNTIQAQVLSQFGMDTYRDPLRSNVVFLHYGYLLAVGTAFHITNLLIEYHFFEAVLDTLRRDPEDTEDERTEGVGGCSVEKTGVTEEAARVMRALAPVTLRTVGNINAGFIDTEGMMKPRAVQSADVVAALRVRRCYGQQVALRGLTLGLPPGQCTVLLGENGAGKSTTFSILTGELKPTSGELYLQGRRVNARDLCQGLISYCPQSDAVDPLLSVKETLEIYCRLRGIENPKKVAARAMAAFELRAHAAKPAGALSGGTRRKLCTALAAAARAPLLLLDEPTSGMDPLSRACVWRAVRAACEPGHSALPPRAALLSTHALDDARRLARRVALLRAGELCAVAPLQQCLRRFGGGYVVSCRVRGSASNAWRRVQGAAPRAVLRVLLPTALNFLLPLHATVDGKESLLQLSDIFRLMTELQKSCDIDDYTVNQSSLDQMFLSFTDKTSIVDLDEPRIRRRNSEEQDSITAL